MIYEDTISESQMDMLALYSSDPKELEKIFYQTVYNHDKSVKNGNVGAVYNYIEIMTRLVFNKHLRMSHRKFALQRTFCLNMLLRTKTAPDFVIKYAFDYLYRISKEQRKEPRWRRINEPTIDRAMVAALAAQETCTDAMKATLFLLLERE